MPKPFLKPKTVCRFKGHKYFAPEQENLERYERARTYEKIGFFIVEGKCRDIKLECKRCHKEKTKYFLG